MTDPWASLGALPEARVVPHLGEYVMASLLTDRRAEPGDLLPGGDTDRRGWWADAYTDNPGDLFGSRLWLLHAAPLTDENLRKAEQYASEALAWMVKDGLAGAVAVVAERYGTDTGEQALALGVTVTRPDGSREEFRYTDLWEDL